MTVMWLMPKDFSLDEYITWVQYEQPCSKPNHFNFPLLIPSDFYPEI